MKVLLVTGQLAKDMVKLYAQKSKVKTHVLALKSPIAAFLTPENISQALKEEKTKNFDVILVPGLVRGDVKTISEAVGTPTFKGPRYAADLPVILDMINETSLSTVTPACELLKEKLQQKALEELENVEKKRSILLKKPGNMLIKDLAFGADFPMRVMAEIVDAALMQNEEIQSLAKHFVSVGASIIDVGMIAGECRPADAKRAVLAVKQAVNAVVSIDSLNPAEIQAAVSAGADLVLSLDAGNVEKIAPFVKDVAVVAIPTNQQEGYFPKKADERVHFLEKIIQKANKLGITKIIADLVLEPSNILESMIAYRDFANRNPNIPLFVGVSNVTELIDADSIGVNAILARLASEVGASIILATEKSDKAKGSVQEEVVASQMMFLSKKRRTVPKDLGVNLLVLKDKLKREEYYNKEIEEDAEVVEAKEKTDPVSIDSGGVFKILVDRQAKRVIALHFNTAKTDKPSRVIKGEDAESIYSTIIALGLVTRLDHAAYLGEELAKAEIALKTGKEYIQDNALFKK
ncbi:MAG: dihydropteroate synthase-like protein [Candidatus Bathyarchaeota archaeon]|nr:dihydropteroate synthase-like protein [Candidatus Bathyarchaeota archaeon]